MNFYGILDDLDTIHAISIIERRKRKVFKNRINPFMTLSEEAFRSKYRFTKSYAKYIVNLVKADIEKDTRGGGISPEIHVLTALRTWSRNVIQDDSADLHGISQRSITNICQRVAYALARKASQYIKMPENRDEQVKVMSGFRRIAGMRNIIGAIDCTHIPIKKVGGDMAQYYINRKGFYSLNVQVICDSALYIRDIVAHWRGSTHDARIFRESRIKTRFEERQFHGRLLGDSGYPCTPYLFTPIIRSNTTSQEDRYNRAHIATRNTVERCFGVWKQRFRCLLKGFNCDLNNVKMYIVALAVLHNIAVNMNEPLSSQVSVVEQNDSEGTVEITEQESLYFNEIRGNATRTAFIMEYF